MPGKNIPREDISGHYATDLDSFKENAFNHFGSEVKDILYELEPVSKNVHEPAAAGR